MGGEGGGTLAGWITDVAEQAGMTAQNTSVAGVAQRTGSTVYYIEIYPSDQESVGSVRLEPVLSLFPTPGEVDIVIASELMEAARSVTRGFTTPDRTLLITSTNRVYSMIEKMAPDDGRADDDALLASVRSGAKEVLAADFSRMADDHRSVISSSLFGALAASAAMPFQREDYESAIVRSGRGAEASLAAFGAGFAAATEMMAGQPEGAGSTSTPVTLHRRRPGSDLGGDAETERQVLLDSDPESLVGPDLRSRARRIVDEFPRPAHSMLLHGVVRAALYQDAGYSDCYLDRVAMVSAMDDDSAKLALEASRHVALWMCYQDTIQVATQKLRKLRLDRVRIEAGAEPDQLVNVYEYLHPRVEEVADTMPERLGKRLGGSRAFGALVALIAGDGMVVNTTSIRGFLMLRMTAALRPIRRGTLRFRREQIAIDTWLGAVCQASETDIDFAYEIILCAGVLKGYGETYHRGVDTFDTLMEAARSLSGGDAAAVMKGLREAALKDADRTALDGALLAAGLKA